MHRQSVIKKDRFKLTPYRISNELAYRSSAVRVLP
jgi:hypothetical protein